MEGPEGVGAQHADLRQAVPSGARGERERAPLAGRSGRRDEDHGPRVELRRPDCPAVPAAGGGRAGELRCRRDVRRHRGRGDVLVAHAHGNRRTARGDDAREERRPGPVAGVPAEPPDPASPPGREAAGSDRQAKPALDAVALVGRPARSATGAGLLGDVGGDASARHLLLDDRVFEPRVAEIRAAVEHPAAVGAEVRPAQHRGAAGPAPVRSLSAVEELVDLGEPRVDPDHLAQRSCSRSSRQALRRYISTVSPPRSRSRSSRTRRRARRSRRRRPGLGRRAGIAGFDALPPKRAIPSESNRGGCRPDLGEILTPW